MTEDAARLDLRSGARVRWHPAHSEEWRGGKLIRSSPNSEEWLVENEMGRSWIHVTRLRPEEGE